ncbi:MAG: DUF4340 domain-containing protein [Phycisphaerales bacterium]|nr:DUF4340 domain-containing protein [Phycisphaerales bacterium]
MNFKLTFALVLVLLVITSVFVLLSNRTPPDKRAVKSETTPLFAAAPKAIKTISYQRDGKLQMTFAREGGEWGKWQLTHPMKAAAEDAKLDDIAHSLTDLSYKEKFEPTSTGPRSAVDTGTQSPRYLVTFTDEAGKQYTLGLGKRTVGGVFATLNGEKTIYVLAWNPLEELDKDPQALREKHLLDVPQENVRTLMVKHADQTVGLTKLPGRSTDGSHLEQSAWMIISPITARAAEATVTEMLKAISRINASSFSDMTKDMPATGLTPPVVSVTAEFTEKSPPEQTTPTTVASQPATKTVTLELGYFTDLTNKKYVYASLAGSSQVFTLPAEALKSLNRQLKDLRDPAVTPAAVGDAANVKITSVDPTHTLELSRKDGHWQIASLATPVKAGDLEVGNFLGDVRNLRAINFSDNAGDLKVIGLDPPQTTIELTLPHQSQHEMILIGKPETADKVTPMMRQGEPTVYMVRTADVEGLLPTALTLRDKEVERLPSERIKTIAISGAGATGGGVTLQREGTVWKATSGGKSLVADDEKITSLLAEFTPLTAAKYLSQDASTSGTPEVTVAVTFTEVATTSPAMGPTTAPASAPAPAKETVVTRTLKIFKVAKENGTSWKAVWDGPGKQWTFEPIAELMTALTKTVYGMEATTEPRTTEPSPPTTEAK